MNTAASIGERMAMREFIPSVATRAIYPSCLEGHIAIDFIDPERWVCGMVYHPQFLMTWRNDRVNEEYHDLKNEVARQKTVEDVDSVFRRRDREIRKREISLKRCPWEYHQSEYYFYLRELKDGVIWSYLYLHYDSDSGNHYARCQYHWKKENDIWRYDADVATGLADW
jgi:hypothetical protein